MKQSSLATPACVIAPSEPGVPTTAMRHPGAYDSSASIATRKWRPDRKSRMRVAGLRGARIEDLRCPSLEHEHRPELPPHVVVASIEAIDQIADGSGVEDAALSDAFRRQHLPH